VTIEEELGNDDTPADISTLPVSSQKASKAKGKRDRDTANSGKREVIVKARKLSAKALTKTKGAAQVKEAASLAKKRKEDARDQAEAFNKKGTVARKSLRSLPPESSDSLDLEELDTTRLQKELDETKKSLDDSLVKLKVREVEIPLSSAF
jgi:hypothetical protein